MDFYKYLTGFNSNKLYTKITLPAIGSLFSPSNKTPSHGTWSDLTNDSNIKNYYYPNIIGYEDYGVKVQLGSSRDFTTNSTSLGSILLSGTKECSVVQEIYGSFGISNFLYTDYIRPFNKKYLTIDNFTQVIIDASLSTTSEISATGKISSSAYVEAPYFNATSDRRAKTNIAAYKGDAVELIKKLPIYTFNYLSDNSASIGMIAQDAAIFDNVIPNFSLVNNEQATGENGDYMTIKESKLVYILWKAIQEQSKQIEELQKKVEQLSK